MRKLITPVSLVIAGLLKNDIKEMLRTQFSETYSRRNLKPGLLLAVDLMWYAIKNTDKSDVAGWQTE